MKGKGTYAIFEDRWNKVYSNLTFFVYTQTPSSNDSPAMKKGISGKTRRIMSRNEDTLVENARILSRRNSHTRMHSPEGAKFGDTDS